MPGTGRDVREASPTDQHTGAGSDGGAHTLSYPPVRSAPNQPWASQIGDGLQLVAPEPVYPPRAQVPEAADHHDRMVRASVDAVHGAERVQHLGHGIQAVQRTR